MKYLIDQLSRMKHGTINNYAIAGLSSSLIGGSEFGKVRLFESSRSQQDSITPHSHRYDFCCLVLRGSVINRVWAECSDTEGDFFEVSALCYSGTIGNHKVNRIGRSYWRCADAVYYPGESYSMTSTEVHSIIFSKDAVVLFFEGPSLLDASIIIEPVVNGIKIPTYETKDYMFLSQDGSGMTTKSIDDKFKSGKEALRGGE